MRRRSALILGLSTIAVLVSGTVFFLVWQLLTEERDERTAVQARARIERFIGLERWDDALEALEQVAQASFSDENAWIPFIRQARTVQDYFPHSEGHDEERETDHGRRIASRVASGAVEAVPDSDRLRAVYALLLIEADKLESAAEQAEVLPEAEFSGIHAELRLRSATDRVPAGDSVAAQVVQAVDDPQVSLLRAAWESSGSVAFGGNAVLRALSEGDRGTAREILPGLARSEAVAEIGFLFEVEQALAGVGESAGDSSDGGASAREASVGEPSGADTSVEAAEGWLESIPPDRQAEPAVLLARADLAALRGEESGRRLLLTDALAADPGYSPVPYLALSKLAETPRDAIAWLNRGLQVRETDTEIAVNLAARLRDLGDVSGGMDVLTRTEEALEGDLDERLAMAKVLLNPEYSAERRRTALWQVLDDFGESEEIASELVSRTARAGDREGLSILRSHGGVREAGWRPGLEAALAVGQGDSSGAVAAFEDRTPEGWSEHYNYGLALLADRRYGSASEAFTRALDRASEDAVASSDKAAILIRAAETALLRRETQQARSYARQALEYEPSSARARLLWRATGEQE